MPSILNWSTYIVTFGALFVLALRDRAIDIQAALMIVMAITGAYLYLLPYWVKWQRQRVRAK